MFTRSLLILFPSSFTFIFISLPVPLASTKPSSLMVTSSPQVSFQVDIARPHSNLDLTIMQLIRHVIKRKRFNTPAPNSTPYPNFESLVFQAEEEFIMSLSLGTPPQRFAVIMDTGSDLIWTQCMPCYTCYHQPTSIFNPNTSSSFSPLPCTNSLCTGSRTKKCETNLCKYKTLYGDKSFTRGYLATDTFILGDYILNVSIPNIAFGCGDNNSGSGLDIVAGIVGLGRGPLSLVSQLKSKKFSYCLPMLGENMKGTLSFGSLADKGCNNASNSQSTPILVNPASPSHYYLSLVAISLDDILLPITKTTFEIKKDGSGGVILDTGTTLTYLVQEAYQVLKQEFITRTRLHVVFFPYTTDLDLCFQTPTGRNASSFNYPKLKLHFEGNVVLELPKDNYLTEDKRARTMCLTIMPSNGMSLLGSQLQQNFVVLHDLEKQTVSFFPSQCAYD